MEGHGSTKTSLRCIAARLADPAGAALDDRDVLMP